MHLHNVVYISNEKHILFSYLFLQKKVIRRKISYNHIAFLTSGNKNKTRIKIYFELTGDSI